MRSGTRHRDIGNSREGIDAALNDFVVHMSHKLLLTRHRPHWSDSTTAFLLKRLKDEVVELEKAYKDDKRKDIVRECADVANFAMMIADNEQWSGTRPWDSLEGR